MYPIEDDRPGDWDFGGKYKGANEPNQRSNNFGELAGEERIKINIGICCRSPQRKMKGKNVTLCRFPCLCLIAAIVAFTLGAFTAPFLGPSREGISAEDPWHLFKYIGLWIGRSSPSNNQIHELFSPPTTGHHYVAVSVEEKIPSINDAVSPPQNVREEPVKPRAQPVIEDKTTLKTMGDIKGKVRDDGPKLQMSSKSEKQCDLFKGKWVEDNSGPLYKDDTCPYLSPPQNCPGNGRPDSGYLNWRWQPDGCAMPKFDAKAFLELMQGKTLAFVGDSVARNQYESLLCMLWQVYKPRGTGNRKWQRWTFDEHKFGFVRIWSSWLVRVSHEAIDFAPENLTKLHLQEFDDKVAEYLPNFDVLVVSSGHWWPKTAAYIVDGKVVGGHGWWDPKHNKTFDVLGGYSVAMKTAMKAIVTNPRYKGLTILRTYSPEHYEGGEWNTRGSCTGKTRPMTDEEIPEDPFINTLHKHQLAAFAEAEEILPNNSMKLRLMDITRPFMYRADGHPGPYRNKDPRKVVSRGPDGKPPPQDCLHWCLPGPIDTWNEFLFEMLKRDV